MDTRPRQRSLDWTAPVYPDRLPGHHGGDTELAAAEAVAPTMNVKCAMVLDLIRSRGARGVTYTEVVDHFDDDSFQRRLSQLVRIRDIHGRPYVVPSGETRPSPKGQPCTVYIAARPDGAGAATASPVPSPRGRHRHSKDVTHPRVAARTRGRVAVFDGRGLA